MDGRSVSKLHIGVLVGAAAIAFSAGAAVGEGAGGTSARGGAHDGAASASCPARWAPGTRGRPARAGAGYRVWRDGEGWHLRAAASTRSRRFVGRIDTGRRLRSVRPVGVEKGDAVTGTGRRIAFRFRTATRDRDGVDFGVACGRIAFDLGADGTAWSARRIYVGADGRAPSRSFAVNDPGASGVEGRVTIGPNCPVEGVPECPDGDRKPVATTVDVKHAAGKFEQPPAEVITSVATDDQGRFRVELPTGDYLLIPRSPDPALTPTPQNVRVEAGLVTRVELMLDTGIR